MAWTAAQKCPKHSSSMVVTTASVSHLASEVKSSMACIMARVTSSASLRRGVMPTGGRHGARSGCSFSMSSVVA